MINGRASVLCVGGSDSSGGAGIQADMKTLSALGVHGQCLVTAVTAQNSRAVSANESTGACLVQNQWDSFETKPRVVKVGLVPDQEVFDVLAAKILRAEPFVIYDPVISSSSGSVIGVGRKSICTFLPMVDLVTPNLDEAEALVGRKIESAEDMVHAAKEILSFGVKAVFLKGGHLGGPLSSDFFVNEKESFWLHNHRQKVDARGTGCTLASAIAGFVARGENLQEAVIAGKSFITQALDTAFTLDDEKRSFLSYQPWPAGNGSLSWLTNEKPEREVTAFPSCDPIGFYPVVDSCQWLERLLPLGVKTVQLRVKELTGSALEGEVIRAIELCERHRCQLFVNDHWRLAVKHNAYGVHLGQEDLVSADIDLIRCSGVRLGVSTHSFEEAARAHAYRPSYIALGPIYPTTSKEMPFDPQGIEKIKVWKKILPYPLVAIGGLNLERGRSCLEAGADGVALITDVTEHQKPEERARDWLNLVKSYSSCYDEE